MQGHARIFSSLSISRIISFTLFIPPFATFANIMDVTHNKKQFVLLVNGKGFGVWGLGVAIKELPRRRHKFFTSISQIKT